MVTCHKGRVHKVARKICSHAILTKKLENVESYTKSVGPSSRGTATVSIPLGIMVSLFSIPYGSTS